MNKKFIGKWYISEMEAWDKDYIDEDVKGYFRFDENNQGEFQFGYVHGYMDCEYTVKDKNTIVEFSWIGNDEMDLTDGRGYAMIEANSIKGKIFIHNADNSEFMAIKDINN